MEATATFLTTNPLIALAAFVLGLLAAARIARVIIYDAFPPAAWLRSKWDDLTDTPGKRRALHSWNRLLHCPWCFVPWVFLAVVLTFPPTLVALWWAWVWWIGVIWMAGAYVGTMIYVRDDPND